MADSRPGSDRRDAAAADRDDDADRRDTLSHRRDEVAGRRDTAAAQRDEYAHEMIEDLEDRLSGLRRQLLDHLQRIEDVIREHADRADTGPSGPGRPRVGTDDENRRILGALRGGVMALIDDLHNEIRLIRTERRAAIRDRHAAAGDRCAAATDRLHSEADRESAARDRSQAAIEREQAEPLDLTQGPLMPGSLVDRVAQAVADSRQHIESSRARLAHDRRSGRPRIPGNGDGDGDAPSPSAPDT